MARTDHVALMIRYRSNFKIISLYIKDTVCDFSNPTDILTVQIMGAFSQFKNTVCKERSSLGKLQKIREGFWLGIEPPYRFALSSHSKGNKLVIVTAEAKWVKQIYGWYSEEQSTKYIQQKLKENDV